MIARHEGNISNLRIVNRSMDFFDMVIDVEVNDVKHLANITAALRATPGDQCGRARAELVMLPTMALSVCSPPPSYGGGREGEGPAGVPPSQIMILISPPHRVWGDGRLPRPYDGGV